MKTLFFAIIMLSASSLMAQSKKDSLFSGKLKNPLKEAEVAKDSAKVATAKMDSVTKTETLTKTETISSVSGETNSATTETAKAEDNTMPDSLNKLYYAKQKAWKRFIDQQTLIISSQADESRKVKKGEYYIEFDYLIGLNGRVKVSNITCSPKNDFVVETVTDIMSRPPVLAPPVYGDGKPRPISAKQQMTILKK